MVIGWGHLGRVFRLPSFTVFVRENRYTRRQIDQTKEFTISIPLGKPDPMINEICGMKSGHDLDKVAAASLTLEEPDQINTPGIREYPLTLECKVLHSSQLDLAQLPEGIREQFYPQDVPSNYPRANKDTHTLYMAEIVSAYIIE